MRSPAGQRARGAGALAELEAAHEELTDAGFESELTVWTDTGHTPDPGWDGRDAMFDFWDRHSE